MTDQFQFQAVAHEGSGEKFFRDTTVNMPSQYGHFQLTTYKNNAGNVVLAITKGEVSGRDEVFLRIHSSCITGDILGSQRCDCQEQLINSLRFIENAGQGMVVYAFQEGRGIGIVNKIRAYALQEKGMNTYEANHALGFEDDLRTYEFIKDILDDFGVKSVALLTNNPDKVKQLESYGITVSKRVPHLVKPGKWNYRYLQAKKEITGHFLNNL